MYTLTQREYINLKSRLTRAENSGSLSRIVEECNRAFDIFEEKGYPDDWWRWDRARNDAKYYYTPLRRDNA